jgi:tRNA-2-methylthio-N6-dimethylallyladenosine synthase
VSRAHQEVLEEVRVLANSGGEDITLIGQNVNAYSDAGMGFAELLAMTSDTARGSRVRFTTSHPKDMSEYVIEVMAQRENICEHLHLPLQSGSNRVLERMRRGYTTERYREIVEAARDAVPGMSITTDIIVGFPGETLEDFEKTCALVEESRFDSAFMFKFSPRPGTEAASMTDDVPTVEKERRLSELISIERRVSSEKSAALVGRVMEVLVEAEKKKGKEGFLLGRTKCNRTVRLSGSREIIGKFVKVRIDSSKGISLSGSLVHG